MNTTITSSGMITNELSGMSANPHECHEFEYTITYTETEVNSHIEWYTEGALPKGLEIDSETGIISGIIFPLHKQPDCQNNLAPKEDLNIDGSNRNNNGTYLGSTHIFNFTVFRRYMIPNPEYELDPEVDEEIEEIASSELSLTVIKSGNISNTIFMESFVNTNDIETNNLVLGLDGVLQLELITDRAHITFEDRKYYKEDLDDLYNNHPGPFAKCPIED